ncbi:MAG: hypothetical protein GEV06_15950 [Luteitalea sp.]|nr:hypothetical protein [Luteitalea sp.]
MMGLRRRPAALASSFRISVLLFCLIGAFAVASPAHAQRHPARVYSADSLPAASAAERLPIRTYSTTDGLAADRVFRIVSDPEGFLWFCTANGLSRFDGERFTTYGPETGLPYHAINDLLITRGGRYLLASDGGGVIRFDVSARGRSVDFSRVRPAQPTVEAWRFRTYRVGPHGAANRVNVLHEDRQGRIWAGTDRGLFVTERWDEPLRFTRVPLVVFKAEWSVLVHAFAEESDGSLWVGTSAGLARRFPDGRMVWYRWPNDRAVAALVHDPVGRLWIGHNHGVSVIVPKPVASLHVRSEPIPTIRLADREITAGAVVLPDAPGDAVSGTAEWHGIPAPVRGLTIARNGHVWLAGPERLLEFDGSRFQSYDMPVSRLWATPLLEDADGNIWTATSGNGALRFAQSGFLAFPNPADAEDGFTSAFAARDGQVCAFTQNGALSCFDGRRFVRIAAALPRHDYWLDTVLAVIQDRDRRWWVGTRRGLHRYPPGMRLADLPRTRPLRTYGARDGLGNDGIISVYEDVRGDVWMGTTATNRRVLARWERATDRLVIYSDADGLPPFNRPSSFAEDRTGTLWIGFRDGGLVRSKNGRFLPLREQDGIPPGDWVSVHVDGSGRLWVATNGGGVLRVDRPDRLPLEGVRYTTAQGLASDHVLRVTEDIRGRIYLGTLRGLNRLDPATGHIRLYTRSDGLISNEIDLSAFRDRRGALWFHGHAGLSRFVPAPDRPARAPQVAIDGAVVGEQSVLLSALGETGVALGGIPGAGAVQIDFVGSSFGAGGQLRYQYKLEGADEKWSRPTLDRTVRFARLAAGHYRFLVRAVNPEGVVSPRAASVTFRVLPPFWLRWWFVLLYALTAGALAVVVHRYRVSRLVELERVRVRIATDLHDDIGSNLSKIALLSGVTAQQVAQASPGVAQQLSSIADISQESVDSMSDIVWAVDPTKDRLHDLALRMRRFASDVFTARDIRLRFSAPAADDDLPLGTDVRREVFLIFKEAVNNIVRHAGATTAEIDLSVDAGTLALVIRDDGKGFCSGPETGDGNGLVSMARRARALGGKLDVVSSPRDGTRITLIIPTRRPRRRGDAPKARPDEKPEGKVHLLSGARPFGRTLRSKADGM